MRRDKKVKELTGQPILIILIIAIAINIYLAVSPTSDLMLIKEVAWDKKIDRIYLTTGIDSFLDKVAPEGNIILKMHSFPELKTDSDSDTMLIIYMRSVFHLYPRRVFAVPENIIVNKGAAIRKNPLKADNKWLQENNVKKIITLTHTKDGAVRTNVDTIYPEKVNSKKEEQK